MKFEDLVDRFIGRESDSNLNMITQGNIDFSNITY